MVSALMMFSAPPGEHVYVSQWYMFGAVLWFPLLYALGNALIHGLATGVVQAAINWWFAHNVLGLWFTPIGLAAAYYLIPKVIGRPIHSYYLSIIGFWTLALFYNWAGMHHLIGGPMPAWLVTVGIVGSMMMFIPVITVAINHHLTTMGALRTSSGSARRCASSSSVRWLHRRQLPGLAAGAALGQRDHALHPLHGRPRPSRRLRLLLDGDVRRDLLHRAAADRTRVAVGGLIKVHFWSRPSASRSTGSACRGAGCSRA